MNWPGCSLHHVYNTNLLSLLIFTVFLWNPSSVYGDEWTKFIHSIGLWNEACGTLLLRCWLIWIPSHQWSWEAKNTRCWEIKTNGRNAGLWYWKKNIGFFNVHTEQKFLNLIQKFPPRNKEPRSQFTLEECRTESILLGLEHVVRGILGISGLSLGPHTWLGGKEKKKLIKKGPYLAELWIWTPCLQLTPCTHVCTNQRAELDAVTLANLRSPERSCGNECI